MTYTVKFVPGVSKLRDLSKDCLHEDGTLRIMPASYYRDTTPDERSWFCVRYGFYQLPTVELVDWLRDRIAGRSVIEIGAGNGAMARALGIRATDSYQQDEPWIKLYYELAGNAPVKYGKDVERIEAIEAVKKYQPEVVIATWVTHRGDNGDGNYEGIDESRLLGLVPEYILIGNEHTHRDKPILAVPHITLYPTWLYSRRFMDKPDFIRIWKKP